MTFIFWWVSEFLEDLESSGRFVGLIFTFPGTGPTSCYRVMIKHSSAGKWFPRTPGSMNSLFGDFFREFWRGILGGVRDYLGEIWGGF